MSMKDRWRAFERSPLGRNLLVAAGILLCIVAVIIGPLPGPGFIPLFAAGLTLLLRYAKWSKRLYVRLKRRWPKQGAFADRGLRRGSAKRRAALARAQMADEAD
ncbi:PGPGW domain-containing protein [Sphingomonas sp. SUN039]|uniref:PGPGW domain-containing protein n=1 Tax=Sphingomonas sp. SUN039 TaxID=2937787 RepID=UPI002164745B|nr:PGPGW domain-containing protein [Sphingomonas sp. SUN039]UVO53040.1 PGPGW domain-containing protein [Sphingomonas sp. SUN039]